MFSIFNKPDYKSEIYEHYLSELKKASDCFLDDEFVQAKQIAEKVLFEFPNNHIGTRDDESVFFIDDVTKINFKNSLPFVDYFIVIVAFAAKEMGDDDTYLRTLIRLKSDGMELRERSWFPSDTPPEDFKRSRFQNLRFPASPYESVRLNLREARLLLTVRVMSENLQQGGTFEAINLGYPDKYVIAGMLNEEGGLDPKMLKVNFRLNWERELISFPKRNLSSLSFSHKALVEMFKISLEKTWLDRKHLKKYYLKQMMIKEIERKWWPRN
jgi:hypothetical protein